MVIESSSAVDIREKIKKYIKELDAEICRCNDEMYELYTDATIIDEIRNRSELYNIIRVQTLMEVKNDLQSRLEGLV